MNLRQFRAMLDAHGVRPENWPRARRAEAGRLLASSPEAVAALDRAGRFDRMVRETAEAGLLPVDDTEMGRMMAAVMARLPEQERVAVTPGPARRWCDVLFSRRPQGVVWVPGGQGWAMRFAVSTVVAVCLGLVVGTTMAGRAQQSYTSVEMLTMASSSYSSSPLDMR